MSKRHRRLILSVVRSRRAARAARIMGEYYFPRHRSPFWPWDVKLVAGAK